MQDNNFNIAWCPFCDQGWVKIVKDPSNDKLMLLCQECETTWEKPEDIYFGNPIRYEFGAYVVTPSIAEIQIKGWDNDLIELS